MRLLSNIKIGIRLVLAFLLVAILAATVGTIGISALGSLQKQSEGLFHDYGMSQGLIGQIAINFQNVRVATRDMILETDKAKLDEYSQKIKDWSSQNNELMAEFKKTINTQKTMDMYNAFEKNMEDYRIQRDKIIQLAYENKNEEAIALLRGDASAPTEAADKSIQDLFNTKATSGQKKSDDMAATTSQTTTTLIIIVILITLFSFGLGLLVANSIGKPLGQIVKTANQLASGNTSMDVKVYGRDEVASLAKAFQAVILSINNLVADANMLSDAAIEGKLATRADASRHSGNYRKVVDGVNQTLDAVIKPVNTAAEQLELMANGGDLPVLDETAFKGDLQVMIINLNRVRASLYFLLDDSGMLAEAARKGDLSVRADISKHKGGYAQIIGGINDTLNAVIEPVNEAAAVLNEMSKGNLSVNVLGDYKGDHAAIKNALNDTINTIKGYIGEISQVLAEIAAGNLNTGIENQYRGEFTEIKDSINNIADSLNIVLGDINNSAEQVAAGTQQVSAGSQALSQGATEQASAIEELTTSLSDIAGQTKQNAVNAGQANELAMVAMDNAIAGNAQMKEMQTAMAGINEASTNISRIIKVIDEIAFQTNLLALNAAVEAARAGQHGKGFAVVAEEVRNLAQRSAAAAKETTSMIEESVKKTKEGTKMADETARALTQIVNGVEKATGLVGEIAKASNEQATAVAQVNKGIEQVSQVVQTNSATAEESAAASEELSGQAALLKDMVRRFSLRGQSGFTSGKTSTSTKPAKALSASKAVNTKPRIALNDRDFGKY